MATAKEFPLSVIIKAVDRITAPLRGIQGAVGRFHSAVVGKFRGFSNAIGLPAFAAASQKLGGALGELGRKFAQIGGGIAAIGFVAAAAAYRLITSFSDAGGEINDVATSIGISAEKLQELRYAAKQNGVEINDLDQSLRILSKNLGQAFKGKGPKDLLDALKIKMKGANGQFKTAEQLIPEIADGLAKIKNPTLRAAAASELFGKSGIKLIPMLKDGSAGLAQYAARARELGIVIGNEAVQKADDFGDKLDDLKGAFTGVRNIIGTSLMPVLTDLILKLTNFITQNGPSIKKWFDQFAADLPGHLQDLRKGFGELWEKIKPVVNIVEVLINTFGGSNVTIAGLALALTAFLLPALISVTAAVWALNVALWANPIGLIIGLLAAVVAGLVYFSFTIEDGRIKVTQFGRVVQWMMKYLSVPGIVANSWNNFKEGLDTLSGIVDGIGAAFDRLWAGMREGFGNAASWASSLASAVKGIVPGWGQGPMGIMPIGAPQAAAGAAGAARAAGAGQPLGAAGVASSAALNARNIGLAQPQSSLARVEVDLNNLPPGSRVRTEQQGPAKFELNQGFAYNPGN